MVSHSSDKFSVHRYCGSEDKMVLVSQRVMRLCGWKVLASHHPPPSLVGLDIVVVEM